MPERAHVVTTDVCPFCGNALSAGACAVCGMGADVGPPSVPPIDRTGLPTAGGTQLIVPTGLPRGSPVIRRPGRRTWLVLATVLVLLLGAGIGYTVLRLTAPTAEEAVEGYFSALADGDAEAALAFVDNASGTSPLLTAEALADTANRPRNLTIEGQEELGSDTGEEYVGLKTSYRVGDATVRQTFVVRKDESADGAWRVVEPFVSIRLSGAGGRPVKINGVAVPTNVTDLVAFPGAFTGTIEGNALYAPVTATGVPASGGPDGVVTLRFGPATLAPGAEAAIEVKVRQQLDECARRTEASPRGCPFSSYIYGSAITVRWTIVEYPVLRVSTRQAGQTVSFSSSRSGKAHYSATYTDSSGRPATDTGDDTFQVYGTARADGAGVAVTLN